MHRDVISKIRVSFGKVFHDPNNEYIRRYTQVEAFLASSV